MTTIGNAVATDAEYLSPEWYAQRRAGLGASEVAAVIGLSPWMSPFDLWWLKRTGEDSQPESDGMRRGKRYESLILDDFEERHPELVVADGQPLLRNADRPWQMCTPDALAYEASGDEQWPDPVAVVEVKTAGWGEGWGEDGTDEIPVYYRCQVQWQMDCIAATAAFMPVLVGTTYREYVIAYDEDDALLLRRAAREFLDSVRDEVMPDVDSSPATLRRLRHLHPSLEDRTAEVPGTLVRQYLRAKATRDRAADRMRLAESRIRHLAGSAASIAYEDSAGRPRTFSHSIYEVAEHTRKATTTDRLNFPRKEH